MPSFADLKATGPADVCVCTPFMVLVFKGLWNSVNIQEKAGRKTYFDREALIVWEGRVLFLTTM